MRRKDRNKKHTFFFKLFLVCLYTAFFAVQVCIRFLFPQTDIHYLALQDHYSSVHAPKKSVTGNDLSKVSNKQKKSRWLNKRYSPVPALALNSAVALPERQYIVVRKQYYAYRQVVLNQLLLHASLRAPPVVA